MNTVLGPIRQEMPATWYVHPSGEKQPVECRYRLLDDEHFGFSVENLNPTLALVIDPGLEWSTFLGGASDEFAISPNGIFVDEGGDILLSGRTSSSDFPTTIGAYDTSQAGDFDVFVTRLNPDLSGSE